MHWFSILTIKTPRALAVLTTLGLLITDKCTITWPQLHNVSMSTTTTIFASIFKLDNCNSYKKDNFCKLILHLHLFEKYLNVIVIHFKWWMIIQLIKRLLMLLQIILIITITQLNS